MQPYSRSQCTAIAAQTQNGMRRTSATSTQLSKREAIEQPNAVNTDLRLAQLPALLSLGQLVEELLAHLMAERPRPLGGSLVRRTCLCLGSSSAKGSGLQKKKSAQTSQNRAWRVAFACPFKLVSLHGAENVPKTVFRRSHLPLLSARRALAWPRP